VGVCEGVCVFVAVMLTDAPGDDVSAGVGCAVVEPDGMRVLVGDTVFVVDGVGVLVGVPVAVDVCVLVCEPLGVGVCDCESSDTAHTPCALQNCGPSGGDSMGVSLMHCSVGTGVGTVQFTVQHSEPRVAGYIPFNALPDPYSYQSTSDSLPTYDADR